VAFLIPVSSKIYRRSTIWPKLTRRYQACSHTQLSRLSLWDTTHHWHRLQQLNSCSAALGSLLHLGEIG